MLILWGASIVLALYDNFDNVTVFGCWFHETDAYVLQSKCYFISWKHGEPGQAHSEHARHFVILPAMFFLVPYAYPAFSRNTVEKLRILWSTMRNATHFYIRLTLLSFSNLPRTLMAVARHAFCIGPCIDWVSGAVQPETTFWKAFTYHWDGA